MIGWVFFRADTLPLAIAYLDVMLDMTNYSTTSFQFAQVLTYEAFYAFLIGLILVKAAKIG
jgi:hypothetical protein